MADTSVLDNAEKRTLPQLVNMKNGHWIILISLMWQNRKVSR